MPYKHEFQKKKQLVINAGETLSQKGLVERTWGNVSVRLDSEYFAISPTGASYTNLKPEDIPIVNLNFLTFVGCKKPSSELLIHSSIYNTYPNALVILHTHQRFASLLSLFFANKQGSIEVSGKYKNILGFSIPSAEYAEAGTREIAENIIKTLSCGSPTSTSKGIILMAAHGILCFASNFDEAFNIVETLEDFAKSLILNILKKHNIFLKTSGKLYTYTKSSFMKDSENPTINKLCSLIFNETSDISYITLSTLPISRYISENLESRIFPNIGSFALQGIPAYFDDAAQIIGEATLIISNINSIEILQNDVKTLFLKHFNALVVLGVGVLCFSQKEDETHYIASIFEKNALAFLLSLNNPDITPLTKENASTLHTSFMQGYSKLKNT